MTREEREELGAKIADSQGRLARKINDIISDEWGLGPREVVLTIVMSVKTEETEKSNETIN